MPSYPNNYFYDQAFSLELEPGPSASTLPGLAEAPSEPTREGSFEKHWLQTLAHVLTDEIQEISSAENMLAAIAPRIGTVAHGKILRAFCEHDIEQNREHRKRLAQIQQSLGLVPDGRICLTMEGMILGLQETIQENRPGVELDERLAGVLHRVKHYEVAAYCGARDFAQLLGLESVALSLQKTLDENQKMETHLANYLEMILACSGEAKWR